MDNENKKTTTNKSTAKKNSATKKTNTTKAVKTKAKTTPKKTTTKKVAHKPKKELNETVKIASVQEKVEISTPKNDNMKECIYCHKEFEKGYTICPHCHKRQKSSVGIIFFIVFALIFLFSIICFHFINKYLGNNNKSAYEYQNSCVLVDYENLIRNPKDYKNKDIKVIGEVVSVSGYDDGFSNNMEITINANLFENDVEQLITIVFTDKDYSQGFIEGDIITVYGKYTYINGNTPEIEAKYIIFGK